MLATLHHAAISVCVVVPEILQIRYESHQTEALPTGCYQSGVYLSSRAESESPSAFTESRYFYASPLPTLPLVSWSFPERGQRKREA